MKKQVLKVLSTTFVAFSTVGFASTLAACSRGQGGQAIDKTKIQLYVHNFAGGFGSEWLNDLKADYEAMHADTKYGDKTGIQVIVTGDKKVYEGQEFASQQYEVYFSEQAAYPYYVASGYVEDITEAVSGANPYEPSKTIESKMNEVQKDFYGYADGGAKKYFGIPHYSGTYGIMYNVDLFDNKGYYFLEGHPDVSARADYDQYFGYPEDDLAPGPDGIKGTADDGLPETFDEFYWLCDYIRDDGKFPLVWGGANYKDYMSQLTSCLTHALWGAEQTKIAYSFEGTANNLVKMDANGKVVKQDGKPVLEQNVAVTSANGYEITRAEARYNSLNFLERILQTKSWHHPKNKNNSQTHLAAQTSFISGEIGGESADSAMLVDGSWWQAEAGPTWKYMQENFEGKQSPLERNFGYMPFPKQKASDEYHQTYTDVLNSLQFVKKGLSAEKKAIAIDFLQFANTDANLAHFTEKTYTTRCLNYELTNEQKANLSLFGKALYEYKNDPKTEAIYPFSKNPIYVNNQASFEPHAYFKTIVDNTTYPNASEALYSGKATGETAFEGSYAYFKKFFAQN